MDDYKTGVSLVTEANKQYWEFDLKIDDQKINIAKIHLALVQDDAQREFVLATINQMLEKRLNEAAHLFMQDKD